MRNIKMKRPGEITNSNGLNRTDQQAAKAIIDKLIWQKINFLQAAMV